MKRKKIEPQKKSLNFIKNSLPKRIQPSNNIKSHRVLFNKKLKQSNNFDVSNCYDYKHNRTSENFRKSPSIKEQT